MRSMKKIISGLLLISLLLTETASLAGCRQVKKDPGRKKVQKSESFPDESGNKTVLRGEDVSLVIPGKEDFASAEITEIAPPPTPESFKDVEMKVYDIKPENFPEDGSVFELRLSYKDFKLRGEAADGNIGAGWYNEEAGRFEGVIFELDEENEEVVIRTNHFSIYACFNIVNSDSKDAYIDYVKSIDDIFNELQGLAFTDCYELLEEAGRNGGMPSPESNQSFWSQIGMVTSLEDASRNVGNLSQVCAAGAFIADSWANQYSDDFSNINEKLGWVTLGLSGLTIARDYYYAWLSKDGVTLEKHQKFATDAYKALSGFATGALVNSIGGVVLLATAPIDNAITEARNLIYENEKDAWRKDYEIYYRDVNPRTVNDWADFLLKARKGARDAERFMLRLEGEIKRYTEDCWKASDEEWLFCIGEADLSKNFGGYFRRADLVRTKLNDKIKEEISQEYYNEILSEVIPEAMSEACYRDYVNLTKLCKIYLYHMKDALNETRIYRFYDPAVQAGESSLYSDAKVYVSAKDGEKKEDWSCTLDAEGKGEIKVTRLAMLMLGAESNFTVYSQGKTPDQGPPDMTLMTSDYREPENEIPLQSGVPFEALAGNYFNGIHYIKDFQLSPTGEQIIKDFAGDMVYHFPDGDVSGLVAALPHFQNYAVQLPFRIETGEENQCTIHFVDVGRSVAANDIIYRFSTDFTYDPVSSTAEFMVKDFFGDAPTHFKFSFAEDGQTVVVRGESHYDLSASHPGDPSYINYIYEAETSEMGRPEEELYVGGR